MPTLLHKNAREQFSTSAIQRFPTGPPVHRSWFLPQSIHDLADSALSRIKQSNLRSAYFRLPRTRERLNSRTSQWIVLAHPQGGSLGKITIPE